MKCRLFLVSIFVTQFLFLVRPHRCSGKFLPLEPPPGATGLDLFTNFTNTPVISGDGQTVAGYARYDRERRPFRWTVNGFEVFDQPQFGGITYDGRVLIGDGRTGIWMWSDTGETLNIGHLPLEVHPDRGEIIASSIDVSGDGSVIVGQTAVVGDGNWTPDIQLFRWDATSGLVGLGLDGFDHKVWPSGVSHDGSVIVGNRASDPFSPSEAVKWEAKDGITSLLPDDEFGLNEAEFAHAVSADGKTIVGVVPRAIDGGIILDAEAFVWTEATGLLGIGGLEAYDVSADGSIVVGRGGGGAIRAFIWDRVDGMRDLKQVLGIFGDEMSDWELHRATAVSDDGHTIIGDGLNPDGERQSWLATIPYNGDANTDGEVDAVDLNVLQSNWNLETSEWGRGDFNQDGIVNSKDLNLLALNWQHGVTRVAADSVPEPESFAVMLIGLIGGAVAQRRHACSGENTARRLKKKLSALSRKDG